MSLPLAIPGGHDAAMAIELCKERFDEMPNGTPKDLDDLFALVVLISESVPDKDGDPHIIAAKVKMFQLGFGTQLSQLSTLERMGLYALAAFRFGQRRCPAIEKRFSDEGVSLRQTTSALWQRTLKLHAMWRKKAEELEEERERVARQLESVLPDGLALREYQLDSVIRARDNDWSFIFNDEMGLGKTIQILGTMALHGKDAFPAFVACPTTLSTTWVEESSKWLSAFDVCPHLVKTKTDVLDIIEAYRAGDASPPMLIGSYRQLIEHGAALQRARLGTLICDESHRLANRESQRSRAALLARTTAASVLEATGTMLPNGRYAEAYVQAKMVDPDIFRYLLKRDRDIEGRKRGDWKAFARHFCISKVMRFGKGKNARTRTQYKGRTNDVEFGTLMSKILLRRTKAEVFGVGDDGMPPKTRNLVWVELTRSDRMALAKIRDEVRAKISRRALELQHDLVEKNVNPDVISDRVKRIVASEAVTMLSPMRVQLGTLKVPWTLRRIKEHLEDHHEILIFCHHHAVANATCEALSKAGIGHTLASGAMSASVREGAVAELKAGVHRVGVLTSAFREGLTLTKYNRLIMLERWWKSGDELQAEDRVHRIGQTRDVGIEYPVCKGTYDEVIGEMQHWKETGSAQAVGSVDIRSFEWLMAGDDVR